MDAPFREVAVVGLGLVGGSLARALGAHPSPPDVAASSLDEDELDRARHEGVVARTSVESRDIVSDCDIVIYATPLHVTLEMMGEHRDLWPPEATVMDVASLKAPVTARMEGLGALDRYVGAHPMAGRQASGFAASAGSLFRDERVWLVAPTAPDGRRRRAEALWTAVGARPEWTDPEGHDRRMARVSHAPQLVATALALLLDEEGIGPDELGTGGRDALRLAGSSPEMWRSIFAEAGDASREVLARLGDRIDELTERLAEGDAEGLEALLRRGREWWEGR